MMAFAAIVTLDQLGTTSVAAARDVVVVTDEAVAATVDVDAVVLHATTVTATLALVTKRSKLHTAGALRTASPSGQMSPLAMPSPRLKLTTSLASPLIPALQTQHSRTVQTARLARMLPVSQRRRSSLTTTT